MLYLEDYLECIEHLPHDLRDRFTEMRELDLTVQNNLDRLESEQQTFFSECKENKQKEWRDSQFDKLRGEYNKILEEADDKVQLGNHIYDLVDRYVRKLDQELQKYKMELEADNAGITETLEQKCLKEMAAHPQITLNNHKSDRRKDGSRRKGRGGAGGAGAGGGAGGEGSGVTAALLPSNSLIPTVVSRLDADSSRASSPNLPSDSTEPSGSRPSSRTPTLAPINAAAPASQLMSALNSVVAGGLEPNGVVGGGLIGGVASSEKGSSSSSSSVHNSSKRQNGGGGGALGSSAGGISAAGSSSSQLNYNPFSAMNNPAIAAAASQAIAATTHMQQGRRTSSLKASYEALRNAGELAKELTFGGSPLEAAGGSGGGSGGGGAYGPNAFVTDATSTKPPKSKKFRPSNNSNNNNASLQASSSSNMSSGGLEGGNNLQQMSSNSNLHFGSSLKPNAGASTSSSASSQSTGQSMVGSQDAFQSGIDDYFGGSVGLGAAAEGADGGTANLVGETEFQPVDGGDWAYDPNEPRYCICNQVSYGEMVGCDNGDCPIEWFHYGCVGLTQAPKGKWFCPQCTAAMKRRNRR